ncbi:Hypothetical predicted protein [Lynx pardinus]|uniref:Uncharacterized protein n=1 Tax=Lynx pardinus TaxID=191816 RepID=A0A485NGF8_LYNPA|nr:Hypothetical predicted protein [Lynx pardinus]
MPRAGALPPKKRSLEPNPPEKGVLLLRSVAGHGSCGWRGLSKPARALSRFCGETDGRTQDASAEDTSFTAELEALRKVFLARPHCPRFSTRATSMCPHGSAISAELSEELRVALDSWKATQDPFSSQQVDGRLLPFSKSACEFNYLRTSESRMISRVPSSPVLAHSQLRKRVPWYISVIHEKVRPSPVRLHPSGQRVKLAWVPPPGMQLAPRVMTSTIHMPLTRYFHLGGCILKD